jgi:ABC-type uncharacterized transport system ATPase subunit
VTEPGQSRIEGIALELAGVSKRFGTTQALHDVSFRVRRGTVHALLGENGAGKSTLVSAAFGLVKADSGTIAAGSPLRPIASPAAAMAARVGMVHQHFTNVPAMTVAENVALGGRGGFRSDRAAEIVREIGRRTGLTLEPDALAGSLPVGAQQRLEIIKALARNATTLLLDEPTAVLAPAEALELLKWLREFVGRGGSVVLITHRLREALAIADDVTVLRHGEVVVSASVAAVDEHILTVALLGEEAPSDVAAQPDMAGRANASGNTRATEIARLRNVWVEDQRGVVVVRDATLVVRAGEVLGVAAVEGSGQHALLRVLAARIRATRGAVELPSRIGFVPEDRQRDGLVLDFSLAENLALRGAGRRVGRIRWRAERAAAANALREFDVRAGGANERARALSGGNQQKLVLARELADAPALVVAENPTRGLDIRAMRDVHARLRAVATDGAAVVLHSSDLDEVLALSDRVVVMHGGAVQAVAGDRESVGRAMLGVA